MMHQQTKAIEVGGEKFEIAWNHRTRSELKKLTGKEPHELDAGEVDTFLFMIHAAIEGAAALRDVESPITLRRLQALFATPEDYQSATEALMELVAGSVPDAPKEAGKKTDPRKAAPSRGRSSAATRSGPSTSASPSASSGS